MSKPLWSLIFSDRAVIFRRATAPATQGMEYPIAKRRTYEEGKQRAVAAWVTIHWPRQIDESMTGNAMIRITETSGQTAPVPVEVDSLLDISGR